MERYKCAVCKQEVPREKGVFLTIPPEGHPERQRVVSQQVVEYGKSCPFICNDCCEDD